MKHVISRLFLIFALAFPVFFFVAVTGGAPLGADENTSTPMTMNPAKPTHPNPGRILKIKEVMRITDEGGDFYFKRPNNIKIAPDQSIFVIDNDQFLRFDPKGTFLGNQQRKGEGPGEYVFMRNYFFSGNAITIYAGQPTKIIKTDLTGKLLEEKRINTPRAFNGVIAYYDEKFLTLHAPYPDWGKAKSGELILNRELCHHDGEKLHHSGLFFGETLSLLKQQVKDRMQLAIFTNIRVLTALDGNKDIYVSNSRQYHIKRTDLASKKITASFGRRYTPVAYKDRVSENGLKDLNNNKPEFFNDVQRIYFHDGRLWVMTSTVEKGKGILIDLFSPAGQFEDSFYLPIRQATNVHDLEHIRFTFHKDCFFTVEKDEEENPVIIKYRYTL